MAGDDVTIEVPNEGGGTAMRLIWTVNPITLGPIFVAIITGAVWAKSLDWRITDMENYKMSRSTAIDSALRPLSDIPYRMDLQEKAMAAQAEKDKAQDARIDRQTDLILNGQDSMRKTVQDGFDGMRKDIGILSTKVEVIGARADNRVQPGSYMRAKP